MHFRVFSHESDLLGSCRFFHWSLRLVPPTAEEFEKGGFTLKTHQMVSVHSVYAGEISKHNNDHSFSISVLN